MGCPPDGTFHRLPFSREKFFTCNSSSGIISQQPQTDDGKWAKVGRTKRARDQTHRQIQAARHANESKRPDTQIDPSGQTHTEIQMMAKYGRRSVGLRQQETRYKDRSKRPDTQIPDLERHRQDDNKNRGRQKHLVQISSEKLNISLKQDGSHR